ncbi:hypothetical protein GIB67_006459 [Kingdonia uniflora]|uniref:Uncharacterized protein n=1 Tax=Kingdonia uniflora TaxID=39325 RepID=A0A7J7NEA1_9MAGN|nr:hypothetical protein GIB67_006459 [Kingdonia uniflora]
MFILKRSVKGIQWVRFLSSSTKLVDTHLIKVFWLFKTQSQRPNYIFIPRNFNLTEDKSNTGFKLSHTFPHSRIGIKGMIVFTASSSPTILTQFRTPAILSEVNRYRAVLCIRSR